MIIFNISQDAHCRHEFRIAIRTTRVASFSRDDLIYIRILHTDLNQKIWWAAMIVSHIYIFERNVYREIWERNACATYNIACLRGVAKKTAHDCGELMRCGHAATPGRTAEDSTHKLHTFNLHPIICEPATSKSHILYSIESRQARQFHSKSSARGESGWRKFEWATQYLYVVRCVVVAYVVVVVGGNSVLIACAVCGPCKRSVSSRATVRSSFTKADRRASATNCDAICLTRSRFRCVRQAEKQSSSLAGKAFLVSRFVLVCVHMYVCRNVRILFLWQTRCRWPTAIVRKSPRRDSSLQFASTAENCYFANFHKWLTKHETIDGCTPSPPRNQGRDGLQTETHSCIYIAFDSMQFTHWENTQGYSKVNGMVRYKNTH